MNEEKKDESLEEKIATREHVVTDQGNGGSYCSHCQYDLGNDPGIKYDKCPGCDYRLIEGTCKPYEFGGSDF